MISSSAQRHPLLPFFWPFAAFDPCLKTSEMYVERAVAVRGFLWAVGSMNRQDNELIFLSNQSGPASSE